MKKDKYQLYIDAVQDPEGLMVFLDHVVEGKGNKENPPFLREDFAGTGINCHYWNKTTPAGSGAVAVDIDPEPLEWGKSKFVRSKNMNETKFCNIDSLEFEHPSDVTLCLNSSIFSIHRRSELLKYFKDTYSRLNDDGVFVFEIYGGPMAYMTGKDEIEYDDFTFIWEQRSFNTLTNRSENHISFKLDNGQRLNDVFNYDHRIWTLPELMDILEDTEFADNVEVYLNTEFEHSKEPDSYAPVTNFHTNGSFEAYIVCYK